MDDPVADIIRRLQDIPDALAGIPLHKALITAEYGVHDPGLSLTDGCVYTLFTSESENLWAR